MKILISNDDGYTAGGIKALAEIMKEFGDVTAIAPKHHQSGMSMAASLGLKQIAYKELGEKDGVKWAYLDATPASCVKFGIGEVFSEDRPDVVVCGINHGSNAASAACYSGTLGAAQEAALNHIPAIGVSLNNFRPDADFSVVKKFFPDIFRRIMALQPARYGTFYNVNFPDIPAEQIKGIRTGVQGSGWWVREFQEWNPEYYHQFGITPEDLGQSSHPVTEEGEKLYMMVGDFVSSPDNPADADHILMEEGYIAICVHNLDSTDHAELKKLADTGINMDF